MPRLDCPSVSAETLNPSFAPIRRVAQRPAPPSAASARGWPKALAAFYAYDTKDQYISVYLYTPVYTYIPLYYVDV